MRFSSPVEKYYNNKRYQFRNITTDDIITTILDKVEVP